ncbi:1471_t:CDS:2, partial [Entrophospora sp. SA101]
MGCKTKISKRLGMQLITIYNILERYNKEGTVENDKRSGKPKSLSDRVPKVAHSPGIMVWRCFTQDQIGPLINLMLTLQ